MLPKITTYKTKIITAIFLAGFSVNALAETSLNQKYALAQKLVQIDGSLTAIKKANAVGLKQMQANMPGAPAVFFEKLSYKINQHDYATNNATIYAEFLTEAELKTLIQLYQSPIGKSIAKKSALVSEAAAKQHHNISQALMDETMKELGLPVMAPAP